MNHSAIHAQSGRFPRPPSRDSFALGGRIAAGAGDVS